MQLNRREFVALTATAVVLKGAITRVAASPESEPSTTDENSVIDAGPISDYPNDEVYDHFREQGFFLIRRDKQLFALSSVCTHKGCKVRAHEDRSFICKCHNSHFDADGKVTKGPAIKNLPRIAVATDGRQHIMVDISQKFEAGHFGQSTTQP